MNYITTTVSSELKGGYMYITSKVFDLIPKQKQHYSPFGIDSCPLPNTDALLIETSNKGQQVVVGYGNSNCTSNAGETIIYCTDENATITAKAQFAGGSIGFTADDQIKITSTNETIVTASEIQLLGGANHLTQFEALDTKLGLYLTALNTNIAAAFATITVPYTPPAPLDISTAKTTNIKTA